MMLIIIYKIQLHSLLALDFLLSLQERRAQQGLWLGENFYAYSNSIHVLSRKGLRLELFACASSHIQMQNF